MRSALVTGLVSTLAAACLAATTAAPDRTGGSRTRKLPVAVTKAPAEPAMLVAGIDAGLRERVRREAAAIDDHLAGRWREHGIEPSPPLDDARFVRRIHLELAGRIPSYAETSGFLGDSSSAKRDALIERLLESPDYVSHFYNHWADVLRLAERPQKNLVLEPYLAWIKDSIRTNRRYDHWVHEMLTADGRSWENPAVGFQLRDEGMPLPYVDNTVRVLLGTQIGCAQCHDHPFDRWTQHQFYELAAFTAGTRTRLAAGGRPSRAGPDATRTQAAAVRSLIREVREAEGKKAGPVIQFIQANATTVSFRDAALKLPHDYRYADARPADAVEPALLWGDVPATVRDADGRGQFAAWVVSRDNRQFARTIANRLWRKVMGIGLVEPVDDFRDDNPPSDPELLEHLTSLVLRLDFDLREYVRVLVSTSAYQRRAVLREPTATDPFRFPGPALRRMTAEQVWDSVVGLIARDPWTVQRPTAADVAEVAGIDFNAATAADARAQFERFAARFGAAASQRRLTRVCGYEGQWLVKASEMPTPLPLGHFLRQFGQSDREAIDGGRTVPTVPQILAMFNGPITHAMLEEDSVLSATLLGRDTDEAVDAVFLSVLSRPPSAADRRDVVEELTAAESATTCGDIAWALLNTREFLFIQ